MPFVNAKCPNCGGTLRVDNAKDAAICPFCKEAYIVESAINNYVTNYSTTIENLHADVVTVNLNRDFEIQAGELIKYTGEAVDVVIPGNVTSITSRYDKSASGGRRGAFEGLLLNSISIPSSVSSIGYRAFAWCSRLSKVTIANGVTIIGNEAFSSCSSLEEVTIPSSVKVIGEYAFSNCVSLKKIIIPRGVTTIHEGAFSGCSSLSRIELPDSVTSIGERAFSECSSLVHVVIPDSVISIGDYAFSRCTKLSSCELPKSNTCLGSYAFSGCKSLEGIRVPDFQKTITGVFSGCESLKSITLPDGLEIIGYGAFDSCSLLSSIRIPPSVKEIGSGAFQGSGLERITIPNSVIKIGNYAFRNCYALTSATIPNGLMWYNSKADSLFHGCAKLTNISISDSMGNGIYSRTKNGGTITGFFPKIFSGAEVIDKRIAAGQCMFCGGKYNRFNKVCNSCGIKRPPEQDFHLLDLF